MEKHKPGLHCGACMEYFSDIEELSIHLKHCPAAIVLLPFIHQTWNGGDDVGHPTSCLINMLQRNANLIKRYVNHVVSSLNVLERNRLHLELCEKLDLSYKDFRPFESEKIIKIPTYQEAQIIFWEAISEKLCMGLAFTKERIARF